MLHRFFIYHTFKRFSFWSSSGDLHSVCPIHRAALLLSYRWTKPCHPFQRCTASIEMVRTCGILNMDLYSLLNHFVVLTLYHIIHYLSSRYNRYLQFVYKISFTASSTALYLSLFRVSSRHSNGSVLPLITILQMFTEKPLTNATPISFSRTGIVLVLEFTFQKTKRGSLYP